MKKIIIFDDDEEILTICRLILEDEWEVFTFNDCKEILTKVKNILPDVILMDNWIPETGGIIATQILKKDEKFKKIPVVFFSANSQIQLRANEAGADSFLSKPFNLKDVKNLLNEITIK